jgi:hypothetical protein
MLAGVNHFQDGRRLHSPSGLIVLVLALLVCVYKGWGASSLQQKGAWDLGAHHVHRILQARCPRPWHLGWMQSCKHASLSWRASQHLCQYQYRCQQDVSTSCSSQLIRWSGAASQLLHDSAQPGSFHHFPSRPHPVG